MSDKDIHDRVVIIIPSRLGSTRFPNKPLAKIDGVEMILRVCQRAGGDFPVIVATPDQEIYKLVTDHGYGAVITSIDCKTGTDRVAEAAEKIDADIYVNVQGDEPLINPDDIKHIVLTKKTRYNNVISGMALFGDQVDSNNIVKVKQNNGQLLGMSRIDESEYKHIGIYAFNKDELKRYRELTEEKKQELLKKHENIEILRFLEIGIPVFMTLINSTPAVDVPDDINKILEVIRNGT